MKKYLFLLSSLFFLISAASLKEANLTRIDDEPISLLYPEVSEEGLPTDHYRTLIQKIPEFKLTVISEGNARAFFQELTDDSRARMPRPGGKCSARRAYIQRWLKTRGIESGKFYISCPANNGRLKLQDQVSRRYYSYSNFHDANIVAISIGSKVDFRIMDLQFEDRPVSLEDYLTKIEASQRIRPDRRRENTNRLCYWYIHSSSMRF